MNPYEIRDRCRSNFNEYLKRAFKHISQIEGMNILDMGCGTGVSILEIARYANCKITAVDSNKDSLTILQEKIESLKYEDRISIICDSIENTMLPKGSFDIILAEGLFNVIGFEKGLSIASGFLAHRGYLIIHDELKDNEMKLQILRNNSFRLITSFELDEKVWWDKYYGPMRKQIEVIERAKTRNSGLKEMFKSEKAEIEMYKKNPWKFKSIYHIAQKVD